ncbi:hypothetical protein TW95_gp1677 [Pandoravirus inopinatum]|uniref:Uncharacterized protein n=1 Tax=Pandoravirus inopinatum TaxID=1605721 RepID=A0A0B5JBL1_9VIRU|nr:hypothetical protein TW95_gp1677 [Pandoravirus inopinatum]AJF98411.1 hypothetical protein [Pandoravirus inopinatum]
MPHRSANLVSLAAAAALFLLAIGIALALPAAGADCRCALAYGDPFWLYNRATGFFCGVACAPGTGARPCPVRCGPMTSRPTPFTMMAHEDYTGVVVTSPSLCCNLVASDNGTLHGHRRMCGPRANGLVACNVIDRDDGRRARHTKDADTPWAVMVKTSAGSTVHDGDEVMLLSVPDGGPPLAHHLVAGAPFSWCHVDGEDQVLWCDNVHAPIRGAFVIWRAL